MQPVPTPSPDRVDIPLSNKKIVLLLAGAILFVATGAWFVLLPDRFAGSFATGQIAIQLIGVVAILFFGACAYLAVRKLPDKKPGLVVDLSGMTDYANAKTPTHIPWQDVEDLWVLRIQNRKLIMIQVRNPEEYIAQERNIVKRRLMKINHGMYGTPLSITSNTLRISFDKLWQLLAEKFQEAHGL